jgi:hypothetical protein
VIQPETILSNILSERSEERIYREIREKEIMFVKPMITVLSEGSSAEDDYVCLEIGCTCCDKEYLLGTSLTGYMSWRAGALVQDAFPEVPKEYREMFISGTCPKCWDDMFNNEDEV